MANIENRIIALEAEAHSVEDSITAKNCHRAHGYMLVDSETGEHPTPEELFPGADWPMHDYVATIIDSLDSPQPEGHVRVGGRRVYAH